MNRQAYIALRKFLGPDSHVVIHGAQAWAWSESQAYTLQRTRGAFWRIAVSDTHAPVGTLYADGTLCLMGPSPAQVSL